MSAGAGPGDRPANVVWQEGLITRSERWARTGLRGSTVWLTGLSGSGKSAVAGELERRLVQEGRACVRLDGDNLRHGLNRDLGFSAADRAENVRRTAEVARLMAEAGIVALVPIISPFQVGRTEARDLHRTSNLPFVEVFVDTPLELCEARDPKGLYRKARAGEIQGMTGIDDPYERPEEAELRLTPEDGPPDVMAERVLQVLARVEAR